MNSKICFDGRCDIQGKSSSTFWGIFINIPKLISQVATVLDILVIEILMKLLSNPMELQGLLSI